MLISMRALANGDTVAETAEVQRDLKQEAMSTDYPNLSANKEEKTPQLLITETPATSHNTLQLISEHSSASKRPGYGLGRIRI
jgi:hypothetical protein